jgi:N-acetylglucosaminyldiphosphoundecaprenol N-acetyl-beta-D-mannosaminyltransferase
VNLGIRGDTQSATSSTAQSKSSTTKANLLDLLPPIVMMGIPFDQVDSNQTILLIDAMIQSRRPHQLATANVDFLALADADPELHRVLTQADLVVCDGMPLVWMSRLLGAPLPQRVAGSELVPLLLESAEAKGHRVFFLGGSEAALEAAEENIRRRWPALTIAGTYSPPFAPLEQMDNDTICARVREAQPDLLLVAFGCPKQEKWLAKNLAKTNVPVGIGVGATLDFLAGTVKQAPKWMRACSLEWIWRIMQEPKRLFRRYWNDIVVVGPGLLRQLWKMRGRGFFLRPPDPLKQVEEPDPGIITEAAAVGSTGHLTLPARFDAQVVRNSGFGESFTQSEAAWLLIDASKTNFIDSTATGKLLRLSRLARERGGDIILVEANPEVLTTLDLMKLRDHFLVAATDQEALALLPASGTVISWPSSVSAATEPTLGEQASSQLHQAAPGSPLTIDLSQVRFIDSTGVGLMLRIRREAQHLGIPMTFVSESDTVHEVLNSLNLHDYLLHS